MKWLLIWIFINPNDGSEAGRLVIQTPYTSKAMCESQVSDTPDPWAQRGAMADYYAVAHLCVRAKK